MESKKDFIDHDFKDDRLNDIANTYSTLCDRFYPDIISMDPLMLYNASRQTVSVSEWRKFLSQPYMVNWLTDETAIATRQRYLSLLKDINKPGSNTQALAPLSTALSKLETQDKVSDNVIVYMSVPLTEAEKGNPNINVIKVDDIPTAITDALYTPRNRQK